MIDTQRYVQETEKLRHQQNRKIKKITNKMCKKNQKKQKNVESLMSRDKIYIIYSHKK